MQNLLGSRLTFPLVHIVVFGSTWLLFWLQHQPLLDGPSRWPFFTVFLADFPISAIAFGIIFVSESWAAYAVITWGILGTIWWYLLGASILQHRAGRSA